MKIIYNMITKIQMVQTAEKCCNAQLNRFKMISIG